MHATDEQGAAFEWAGLHAMISLRSQSIMLLYLFTLGCVGPDSRCFGWGSQEQLSCLNRKTPSYVMKNCTLPMLCTNFSQDVTRERFNKRISTPNKNKAFLFGSITPEKNATMSMQTFVGLDFHFFPHSFR